MDGIFIRSRQGKVLTRNTIPPWTKPRIGGICAWAYATKASTSSALLTSQRNATALTPWLWSSAIRFSTS